MLKDSVHIHFTLLCTDDAVQMVFILKRYQCWKAPPEDEEILSRIIDILQVQMEPSLTSTVQRPLTSSLLSQSVCHNTDGRGEEEYKLLHSCCTAEGSIEQISEHSILAHWDLDDQHNMADCPSCRPGSPTATPVTLSTCLFMPVPSPAAASTVSSVVNPAVPNPTTDTCGPISSVCSSAWDTLRPTSRSPGNSEWAPASAAAHLHLLGESLSLIGLHLQETNKMVSVSISLSLLLDSLLCAVAPLLCLTVEIPELEGCTQHTLVPTLENIAYLMPGM